MLVTLDNWEKRMGEDMRLVDYRPRTQEGYSLVIRLLLGRTGREPEAINEEDVRSYFLHLRDERKQSASYLNIAVCALRFFFQRTLRREWEVFDLLRVQRPKTLPVVLAPAEVRALLCAVKHPARRLALTTIYALGLRLGECLRLEASDIDGPRLLVWVRDGKGAKDRGVPLPTTLLERLRRHWKHERPSSKTRHLFVSTRGQGPFEESTLQKTFTAALRDTRIQKHATIHSLRHSYATHLVEAGVSLRTVQELLGHQSLRSTEVYLHVTTASAERVQAAIESLVEGLLDFGAHSGAAQPPTVIATP